MATSAPTTTGVTTWNIDPSHSLVEFSAKHMMITTVKGRIAELNGTITIDENDLDRSSAEVEFVAASLDTRAEQRDAHLRSADFLDVEQFPTLSFTSTGVRQEGEDWVVTGDLTIHGVTRSVELETEFEGALDDPFGFERIAFSAQTEIDRTEFGLTWNQALETGNLVVGKKVRVNLEVEAVRPKA